MAGPGDSSGQIDLASLFLSPSAGGEGPDYSINEAVALYAGEPRSMRPWKIECPVIGWYVLLVNDAMPDDARQRLIPYISKLASSRSNQDVEAQRAYVAADWAVRRSAPQQFRTTALVLNEIAKKGIMPAKKAARLVARLQDRAARLQDLPPIKDRRNARKALGAVKKAADATFDEANDLGAQACEPALWAHQAALAAATQESGDWPQHVAREAASAVIGEAQSHKPGFGSRHADPGHIDDWNDCLRLLEALLAVRPAS